MSLLRSAVHKITPFVRALAWEKAIRDHVLGSQGEGTGSLCVKNYLMLVANDHQRREPCQQRRETETDSLAPDEPGEVARLLHRDLAWSQSSCLMLHARPFSDPAALTAVHWGVKVTYIMVLSSGSIAMDSTNRGSETWRKRLHLY